MTAAAALPDRSEHIGELRLRRFRLAELSAEEAAIVEAHTLDCATCRGKLRALEGEEARFRAAISFDEFAAGVSRAHRVPRPNRRRALGTIAALSATAATMIFLARDGRRPSTNSIKGEVVTVQLRIAGPQGQRALDPGSVDSLQPGERVRLGYRTAESAHLVAVSIDDQGKITPLYPEAGTAIPVEPSPELRFLPDSLEFTGQGKERVFLLLAPGPFAVGKVEQSIGDAFQAARHDLTRLRDLPLPASGARSFTWLIAKP